MKCRCGKDIKYKDEIPLCDKCYREDERMNDFDADLIDSDQDECERYNLAIVGSRTLNSKKHFKFMKNYIDNLIMYSKLYPYEIIKIISGGCPEGGDRFAKKYARYLDVPIFNYFADWNKYGNSAGAVRNKEIVKNSDKFVVFWDGSSKGTKITIDMIRKAKKKMNLILLPKEEELLEYI